MWKLFVCIFANMYVKLKMYYGSDISKFIKGMEKFNVTFLEEAGDFLDELSDQPREKILYNVRKAKEGNDSRLFKKVDEEIWEFRTEFNSIQYRLLAFWDKRDKKNTLVIATNGFVKKRNKIPKSELEKAKRIRNQYFIEE